MSDTSYSPEPLNWALPPAPGYPGYQPKPQAQRPPPQLDPLTRPAGRFGPVPNAPIPPEDPGLDPGVDTAAGGDTPPPSNEPYIPSRADRPPNQWGTDDFALAGARRWPGGMAPGPLMPQANEIAGLLHGIVMGMGRYGSRYSGMPAIAMGTYASAYWKAYQAGMHQRANQSWQQYQHSHQMFLDRQKEEFQAESEAYALYQDDPEKLHNALMQLAAKYHDLSLQNALESGNPAAVDRLLQLRDKHWQDAAKIKQQQELEKLRIQYEKMRNEALRRKLAGEDIDIPPEWRDPAAPGGGGGGGGAPDSEGGDGGEGGESGEGDEGDSDGGGGGGNTGGAGDTPAPDSAAAPARPPPSTAGAGAGGAAAPSSSPGALPGINPLVKEAADELVRTGKVPQGVPKGAIPRVGTEAAKQKAALNDLMEKGGITGDNEQADLAAIRKINPELANDVEAMGHGMRLVPSGGENMYANMENLVRKVYKNWDPGVYDYIKEFKKGPESKIYESVGTLRSAAEGVLRELQNLDENASPPKNWIDKETGHVSAEASAKWGALANALFQYIEESITIQNGGRRPLASQTAREILAFPITRGAKTIRALLTTSAMADVGRIEAANHTWHSNTHLNEPPPGYDEHSTAWVKALADMNYDTGYMRNLATPVPDDLKPYLGPAGKNLHKGGTGASGAAHTPEEIAGAKAWLADPRNANDPRRAKIEEMIKGK